MKNIRDEEFAKLISIIPEYPGVTIFHMTDEGVDFCQKLDRYANAREYTYHLVSANEAFITTLHEAGLSKARKITYKQQRYNQHSKLYDFIYIEVDVESLEKPELFLKKIYAIAKNGAKILFFLPKEREDFAQLEQLLEKGNFVAINPIDDMFVNYNVLSAQKMHGWGVYDM
ncbi:MAG: hypothetical protein DSZ05_09330 [Sulfurospirillum sp.]|nr:MAG: hypothetical protein DSZ05_09330 [Sulfurospirillum sp.]